MRTSWTRDLGSVSLDPATAVAEELGCWTLRYEPPAAGLAAGACVKVSVLGRCKWPMFQTDDPAALEIDGVDDPVLYDESGKSLYDKPTRRCSYVSAEHSAGGELAVGVRHTMITREIWVRLGSPLASGQWIEIRIGDKAHGTRAPWATTTLTLDTFVDADGESAFVQLSDCPILTVLAGPPARLKATIPSDVAPGTPFPVHVCAFDRHGNPCADYDDEVRISDGGAAGLLADRVPLIKGVARVEVTLAEGNVARLVVESVSDPALTGRSNPARISEELPGTPLWWGDFHGHCILSDGREDPDFYYSYARDFENLDFAAVTGHDDCLVNRAWWQLPQTPYWRTPTEPWSIQKYVTNRYHRPGSFVAFVAYEWSGSDAITPTGLPRFGDRNVYFPSDDGEIFAHVDERYQSPAQLWEVARAWGALVIPHHPGYWSGGAATGVNWDFHSDEAEPLVEIYSKHGCSECEDTRWPLFRSEAQGMVRSALARGYKLGFVAGSDSHISRPGSNIAEEDFPSLRYPKAGITAVRATGLTRGELLSALRRRACYATTGERIWLDVSVNGVPMGNELEASPGDALEVSVEVHGTAEIEAIELVRDGAVVESTAPQALSATARWTVDAGTDPSYLYVRVTQVDGAMAWASPVWVAPASD